METIKACDSSIITRGVLPKTDAIFPLAGSVRRRRSRRHDLQQWSGRQAGSAPAAGVQPDFLGDYSDQVEPAAAGADAKRAFRARVSQGATAAGYRRRSRSSLRM